MKKIAASLFALTCCLWAADVWTKPYTDWTDKDIQKISESSPWSRQYSIPLGGMPEGPGSGRGKGGGGGMGKNQANSDDPSNVMGNGAALTLTIRWQSALPMKQAFVRMKYRAEAGTSPEAQKMLSMEEPAYVIVVSGLNRKTMGDGGADEIKQTMLTQTALVIKGKEPIKPIDFRINGQGRIDAVFAFPKTNPITVDDKEVEFHSKLGVYEVKQKFHLKEMVYNGKLEL